MIVTTSPTAQREAVHTTTRAPRVTGSALHLHLSAVETLLVQRLDRLVVDWREATPELDPVLGEHDVPTLLRELVLSGGKRLRPQLCHLGWAAAGAHERGDDAAPIVQVSAALELLHAFGLAQDDVMDASQLRRGTPAVHVVAARRHRVSGGHDDSHRYGESIAVLVGDLAHVEADDLVADLPRPVRRLWWSTSVELLRGQVRDLGNAARAGGPGSLARALEVAHAKSGAYTVQRPLQLGATLGGAGPELLAVLTSYGACVGEAFALRDDLLGVWGDPAVTGKPASDDLGAGKATVLLALAEQRCTGAAARAVARVRRHEHDQHDITCLREAMVEVGVRDEVEQRIEQALADAISALDPDLVPHDVLDALSDVATTIARRNR